MAMDMRRNYKTIDAYVALFPKDMQILLQKIRTTIHNAAPEATEAISYGIPTFKFHGNLVHFGAYTHHISFYPTSSPIPVFKKELAGYTISKGTIQFPLDKPIPYNLVTKIVEFRIKEVLAKHPKV
jgi:uncharacterized protein YdhG (YjbR/CyaY superfamily)